MPEDQYDPNNYPNSTGGDRSADEALGQSEAFLEFQERLSRVARIDRPVLLIGERGTGKELAATRLHYLSKRWQSPLVTLNCAALAPSLIESELFGYEAGAFTGATRRRTGRFEMASQGTLFLDEMANIPIEVQEKILRVVEYGAFERVGGSRSIQVDVRIIGATNINLPVLVKKGQFKQDLLDRLSFEVLFLPPLREREGDILILANHFAARIAFELGREQIPEFSEEAIAGLEHYPWPGNVRELKNVVERAVYRAEGQLITNIIFDPFQSPYQTSETGLIKEEEKIEPKSKDDGTIRHPFTQAVRQFELRLLQQALTEARFNQKKAAHILGLTYHQFRGIYRKYKDELKG
ncbi:MAG: phage shock protein operon transcriptional activator [Deltaproteobacteria bacterium]|nr:phage shock protein operon transcriptional activator [Deltaproteobacteria bacterium]MBW2085442.1 phage shock protein operon transcriptional activator [Deltaproteobacteria bacterium]